MRSLLRTVGDLATARFLLLSLLPLLVVAVLLVLALGSLGGGLGEAWSGSGQEHWLVAAFGALPWVGGLADFGWFRGFLGLVSQLAGWLLLLLAALFLAVAVVGMLTPWIVAEVRRRHYPEVTLHGFGSVGQFLAMTARTLGVFVLLWLPVIPLLFVPPVNAVAINLPFYYWFHRMLVWDVASSIYDLPGYRALPARTRWAIRARTLLLYPLSLLPVLGILLQVAFVLLIAHTALDDAARTPSSPRGDRLKRPNSAVQSAD